jgi:osmotically-inducible protein OsmY
MRKLFSMTAAVVLASALGSGSGYTQTPAATSSPADKLEDAIEHRWENDSVLKACKGCDFDVDVTGTVAKLTGEAPSADMKERAARLAEVSGVTRVDNQIDIVAPGSKTDSARSGANKAVNKTAEGVDKAAEKTSEGVSKAAEKTGEAVSKTGEVIDDAWITTKVKSQFMTEDAVDGSHIEVDTTNNVVTLKGTVPSEAAHAAALRIARETKGVKRVVDNLRVGPKTN